MDSNTPRAKVTEIEFFEPFHLKFNRYEFDDYYWVDILHLVKHFGGDTNMVSEVVRQNLLDLDRRYTQLAFQWYRGKRMFGFPCNTVQKVFDVSRVHRLAELIGIPFDTRRDFVNCFVNCVHAALFTERLLSKNSLPAEPN